MCPREKHTRPLGFMEFVLYEKLIKEIADYRDSVKSVHLHNYGEPLLDKELPRRIKLAKDLGIRHVYFVTNASLLTPDKSTEIIEAGLDEFKISFYGTDKETYNETMKGLDFDRSIQNVRDFFKIRKEFKKTGPKVIIQYLPQMANRSKIKDFLNIFSSLINKGAGDSLNVFSLHNFGDGRAYHKVDKIVGICNYPWRTMVILHDGRVVLCCLDYNGVQVVGDVNKNTIEEIWNSERYKQVRENFKSLRYGNYPICKDCTVII
jgi:radical SAM protein with 4Fe4S-binding SPASM domain